VPLEEVVMVRLSLPVDVLPDAIYLLGKLRVAMFEERPERLGRPRDPELWKLVDELGKVVNELGGAGQVELPPARFASLVARALETGKSILQEVASAGDEVSKAVKLRQALEKYKDEIAFIRSVYTATLKVQEVFNRCAYSEGYETGRALEAAINEYEEARRRAEALSKLYAFLVALREAGYSEVKLAEGCRFIIEPKYDVLYPHVAFVAGGMRVVLVCRGVEDFGGVVVPREYLESVPVALEVVASALREVSVAVKRLEKTARDVMREYSRFSNFGDMDWDRHADVASVAFYVRARDLPKVDEALAKLLATLYVADPRARVKISTEFKMTYLREIPREKRPVIERYPPVVRSFVKIVYMYGLPSPGEVPPVPLVAVLFPLFFGWMYGDVGHGLLLLALSLLIYRVEKWRDWGVILGAAAVLSILFGMLRCTAFGVEFCTPLLHWHESMYGAFLFGYVVMALAFVLHFVNMVLRGEALAAVALVLPSVLLYMLLGLAVLRLFMPLVPAVPWCLYWIPAVWLALGLLLLYVRLGKHFKLVIEEVATSYVEAFIASTANVLSFSRLFAIMLIHETLSRLVNRLWYAPGGFILVPLGHLLVASGEAFLAFVQSLRLVYYETLSKFYQGRGRPFTPFEL